jgi:hypothetical protein
MTYVDALKKGLEESEKARRANAEIDGIFAELAKELGTVLAPGFTLKLERGVIRDPPRNKRKIGGAFMLAVSASEPSWVDETEALMVRGGSVPSTKLCEVERAVSGYPVRLSYADLEVQCRSRVELEAALENMLKHPEVASRLSDRLKPEQPTVHE